MGFKNVRGNNVYYGEYGPALGIPVVLTVAGTIDAETRPRQLGGIDTDVTRTI